MARITFGGFSFADDRPFVAEALTPL